MSGLKEKYRNLVERLFARTRDGTIEWNDLQNDVYCSLKKYDVHLKASRDAEGDPIEILELRDQSNQIIDRFDDTEIAGPISGYGDIGNYYVLMVELRKAARRKDLGADQALDDVLKDLESDFDL